MGKKINFFILSIIVIICVYSASNYQELTATIDSGDTAWMIVASALPMRLYTYLDQDSLLPEK